ncbi:MAG TPA: hypothetical protein PKA76_17645 [Pirellulaceae bacterium]|nr:hypothetical protein [Pirellulaceae bacterium]HMP71177.1 hypothetical protein [Pirellulaceae bacterium]
MNRLFIIFLVVLACEAKAFAHEGHGTPGEGHTVKHYLLEPTHLPSIIVGVSIVFAAIAIVVYLIRRRKKIRAAT